ncbi:MAG: hypothetical protein KC503_03805 [Myxococcales bacterium]|nr:hypothetical protein [Myxococcales bacterium]
MQPALDARAALGELEQLAEKLDVELMYDHFTGDGARTGGLCKVKGRWRIIVERRASPSERVSVLARGLARVAPEEIEVSQDVQVLIDTHRPKKPQSKVAAAAAPAAGPQAGS